jgi:hypothetical protein
MTVYYSRLGYVRHIIKHTGPNRAERRKPEAQARHKGNTPHGLGKRKPKGWRGPVAAWRHPCKRVYPFVARTTRRLGRLPSGAEREGER